MQQLIISSTQLHTNMRWLAASHVALCLPPGGSLLLRWCMLILIAAHVLTEQQEDRCCQPHTVGCPTPMQPCIFLRSLQHSQQTEVRPSHSWASSVHPTLRTLTSRTENQPITTTTTATSRHNTLPCSLLPPPPPPSRTPALVLFFIPAFAQHMH
jgi:hypothetical protein